MRIEELFDKYFNEIRELSRHTKEEMQEFQCLEYEYEAYVTFKRQPYESFEERLMESFKYVAAAIYEHERMCELVGRIFEVGEPLISHQKNIFICNVRSCDIQKAWFLEAYGEEYAKRKKWGEAQENYWEALDRYMAILKTGDTSKIKKCFYDGQAYPYICDVIYRIYGCIETADDYETAIEYFRTREKEYMEILYFHKYYASTLYVLANKTKSEERKVYLEKCIDVINYVEEEVYGIELYELKCGSLFLLEKYDELDTLCEKALENKYYGEEEERILR